MQRIVDINQQLIELSARGRFWQVDIEELSPAEQVFRAIWELEGEVNNGGFDQYYFNSSGDIAFAVVDALKTIGAESTAQIVAEANSLFPKSVPPRDRAERQALLDAFGPEQKAALDRLDEQFYGYPDDLTTLLHQYVKQHSADIPGAADVGI